MSCSCIAVDPQGRFIHERHDETSIFQKPKSDIVADIYSQVYLHYLFLKEPPNDGVLMPTPCWLILKKSLSSSSVYIVNFCI